VTRKLVDSLLHSITRELITALQLVGVRVLDHLVVTAGEATSMAARGLL
jgi:DNA repair protein RadC